MATVTGKGSRNVTTKSGKKLANVTKEQLKASGLSLRQYLNQMDKTGKRPGAAKPKPKVTPKVTPAVKKPSAHKNKTSGQLGRQAAANRKASEKKPYNARGKDAGARSGVNFNSPNNAKPAATKRVYRTRKRK